MLKSIVSHNFDTNEKDLTQILKPAKLKRFLDLIQLYHIETRENWLAVSRITSLSYPADKRFYERCVDKINRYKERSAQQRLREIESKKNVIASMNKDGKTKDNDDNSSMIIDTTDYKSMTIGEQLQVRVLKDHEFGDPSDFIIDDIRRLRYNTYLYSPTSYRYLSDSDVEVIDNHHKYSKKRKKQLIDKIVKWLNYFMPHLFDFDPEWDPKPEYVLDMIEALLFETERLVLLPRDHGKTYTLICVFVLWTVELKRSLTAITSPGPLGQARIYYPLLHAYKTPRIRYYYGDLMDRTSRDPVPVIHFNPTLQKSAIDPFIQIPTITQKGFVGSHTRWTHLTDVEQEPPVGRSTVQRMYDNFDNNITDLSKKTTAEGTRKGSKDYYFFLLSRGFKPLHYRAVEIEGNDYPTDSDFEYESFEYMGFTRHRPIALTKEYLERVKYKTLNCPKWTFLEFMIKFKINPKSFFSQQQNEPIVSTGNFFKPRHYIEIEPISESIMHNSYIYIDPAFGESKESSDTAIAVCSHTNGITYVKELIVGKIHLDSISMWLMKLRETYNIVWASIENDFAQVSSRSRKFVKENRLTTFYSRGQGVKVERIELAYDWFEMSDIVFFNIARDRLIFRDQMLDFDFDPKQRLDAIDIIVSAHRDLSKKLKSKGKHQGIRII